MTWSRPRALGLIERRVRCVQQPLALEVGAGRPRDAERVARERRAELERLLDEMNQRVGSLELGVHRIKPGPIRRLLGRAP